MIFQLITGNFCLKDQIFCLLIKQFDFPVMTTAACKSQMR
jgi:hypothetical protein